ncbi:3-deoxy-7-phosphoheptulonate synthase [Candidatus Uabimicrobium sp. HlEnr_7]|uniref:3-deoxy-7-phosphoheptulonate synthase n=1 Tax=Candidatus Uabimicrobium helgolandensis TaxID=3095367 RepID=UPI0035571A70
MNNYETQDNVEKTTAQSPYLYSRKSDNQQTTISLGSKVLGSEKVLFLAGPCSVESKQQMIDIAYELKEMGVTALRGGAYKPRTSPYSFQGHGEKALEWLAEVREKTGLAIVTEIMDPHLVPLFEQYVDVLQIGSRNMQNFVLLKSVGKSKLPVLLKRGMSSTIQEFLLASEYVLSQGNPNVILCERGIRTFENATRNTFDINAIPVLREKTHLPILADPSHGTGNSKYVLAVSRGAVAAGADGLLIEVHASPEEALSDGDQSITPQEFRKLVEEIGSIAHAVNRTI